MQLGEFLRTGSKDYITLLHNSDDKTYTMKINGNPDKMSFIRYIDKRYEFGSLIEGVFDVVDYMECGVLHSGIESKERLIEDYLEFTREMILKD